MNMCNMAAYIIDLAELRGLSAHFAKRTFANFDEVPVSNRQEMASWLAGLAEDPLHPLLRVYRNFPGKASSR